MRPRLLLLAALLGAVAAGSAETAQARTVSPVVRAGAARFEVLTPTLIRLEYAADRRFTDAPTMTVPRPGSPCRGTRRGPPVGG